MRKVQIKQVRCLLGLVLGLLLAPAIAMPDNCQNQLLPSHPQDQDAFVRAPGRHCLGSDFNQPAVWGHDGRELGLPYMLAISAPDAAVDFAGHTLRSKRTFVGKVVFAWPYLLDKNVRPVEPLQVNRNLRIHDGKIQARASYGVYFGGFGGHESGALAPPISLWSDIEHAYDDASPDRPENRGWVEERAQRWLNKLPATAADYPERNLVLENLTIEVESFGPGYQGLGALLQGAGTIIRNCVIKVDKQTAIFIYGPRALIENNTIVVKGEGARVEGDAPIRLHQGDGSIIRNNKIIRKDSTQVQAVTLVKSADVVFENNELFGFKDENLVRTFDEGSSYHGEGNTTKPLGLMERMRF